MLAPSMTERRSSIKLGNRYQLMEPLGTGGMGAVYRARDQLTGQEIALKRLPQIPMKPASSDLRLALAHEFQSLAALRHPGIITVRDYGFDAERQPYFTMELLPFAREFTAAGELLPDDGKIDLLLQLLTTLIYVHRCGIIHRDLKPGNVLVTPKGEVKVLDFGLSGMPGEERPTSGTLLYMAPETLQGLSANLSSDLYAVGVMAFELFAGWHPFAHAANLVQAILHEAPDFSIVEISADLQAVLQRLLAKEPENRYTGAAETVAALCAAVGRPLPPETAAARESFLQAAPFIGRTNEMTRLDAARRQALDGQGSGLLISGESGIGKSRLLQEIRIRALVDGMLVFQGQAQPNGAAYHLWREILRPLLLHAPPDDLEAAVLQAIIPDVAALLGKSIPPAPPLPPQEAQNRLWLTVFDLLQRAASCQPLLLILEDLHWADENSLSLLQNISVRLDGTAICIAGSYRSEERPQLAQTLAAMEALRLDALSADLVADLSVAILGEKGRQPTLLRFLERETEGNTFFIVEVVRALAEEAGRLDWITDVPLPATIFPSGIQEAAQRRLERVPTAERGLLDKAAVAGRQLDLQLLAHLSPQTALEDWLTICANAGVLERPPGAPDWQFSHDKLREALLRQSDEAERRQRHGQIAAGLETIYAADLSAHYGSLAYHYAQAGAPDKERLYLELAARRAETIYANEAAIGYYQQLLGLLPEGPEQATIYLALGGVYKLVGRRNEAYDYLQAAAALPAIETALQAQIYHSLGNLERSRQQYEAAMRWLEKAQASYERLNDLDGVCQIQVEQANIFYQQGNYETALQFLNQAMTIAQELGNADSLSLVKHNLGSVAYSQGDYETADARYQEALALRREAGNLRELADSYNNLGLVAFRKGDWPAAQSYLEQSLALRREAGDRWGTAASLSNLGMIPYQQRQYETARRYWEEALQAYRLLRDARGIANALDNLALVVVSQAEYAAARELMKEVISIRQELNDRQGLAITWGNQGRLALLMLDWATAENDYRVSLQIAQEIGDQLGMAFALTGIAGVRAGSGSYAAAATLLAAAFSYLEQIGGAWESDEKAIFDQAQRQAQSGLTPEAYTAAWEAGRTLSPTAALELVWEAKDAPITC